MANTRSARKQGRVNERRRIINQSIRTRLTTAEKKFRALIKEGDKAKIAEQLKAVFSLADRSAQARVISRNAASRKKSRLSALFNVKK